MYNLDPPTINTLHYDRPSRFHSVSESGQSESCVAQGRARCARTRARTHTPALLSFHLGVSLSGPRPGDHDPQECEVSGRFLLLPSSSPVEIHHTREAKTSSTESNQNIMIRRNQKSREEPKVVTGYFQSIQVSQSWRKTPFRWF